MLGSIICSERIKQEMKQAVLCKGICSISYLSKIENMQTSASEEIIQLLFLKLGINYITDICESEVQDVFNKIYNGYLEQNMSDEDLLSYKEELHRLKYSKFYWEVLLNELLLSTYDGIEADIDIEGFPREYQLTPYYAIYCSNMEHSSVAHFDIIELLLMVRAQDNSGIIEYKLMINYFVVGMFNESVKYGELALASFGKHGYVKMQLECHFNLALSYTYLDPSIAMHHYEACIRVNQFVNDELYDQYLKYNIGAEYLVQYLRNEDIALLVEAQQTLKSIECFDGSPNHYYEKLIIIEQLLGNQNEVNRLFKQLVKVEEGLTKQEGQMLSYIAKDQKFYLQKDFVSILFKVYKNDVEHEKFTRSLFVKDLLIFCYRKQNKYKAIFDLN